MINFLSFTSSIAKAAPTDKCILELNGKLNGKDCSSELTNIIIALNPGQNIPVYQVLSACNSCLESLEQSNKCYLGTITNLKEKYPIASLMGKKLEDISEDISLTIKYTN